MNARQTIAVEDRPVDPHAIKGEPDFAGIREGWRSRWRW
jgi:hypothetical protein